MSHIRRSIAVTVLVVGALALPGCAFFPFFPRGGGSDTVTTHTDEDVAAELEAFYKQDSTWNSDGGEIDTTSVTVPLDWSDPTGQTVQIAVARHRASDPIGSLLLNPGGPAGSGYDYVEYAQYVVTPEVLAQLRPDRLLPPGVNNSTPGGLLHHRASRTNCCTARTTTLTAARAGSRSWASGRPTGRQPVRGNRTTCSATSTPAASARHGRIPASSSATQDATISATLRHRSSGTRTPNFSQKKVGRMALDGAVDPL